MKIANLVLALAFLFTTQAHASCFGKALDTAIAEYGNDPKTSSVKQINDTTYKVAVGKGNMEDGQHNYTVSFTQGCKQKAVVKEVNKF